MTPRGGPALRISVGRTKPFPAEKLAKIFLPFEQADSSATSVHGGTGLGLSIFQAAGGTHARADLGRELGRGRQLLLLHREIRFDCLG